MKLSKKLGRAASALLATAMLAAFTAVPASAAAISSANDATKGTAGYGNGDAIGTLEFTSELWLPEGVSVPDATFKYTLAGADASTDPDYTVSGGTVDVLTGEGSAEGKAEFDKSDDSKLSDSGKSGIKKVSETVSIDVSKLQFKNVGVYKYTLKQELDSKLSADFNLTQIDSRVVYLFVGRTSDSPETYTVTGAVMVNKDSYDSSAKSNGTIINFYLVSGNPDNPDDGNNPPKVEQNTLTISNAINGAMGDKTATFPFDFTVTSTADNAKEFAYIVTKDGTPGAKQYAVSGTAVQGIELGDGDMITIYGLSDTDSFNVSQTTHDVNGYDTKIGDEDIYSVSDKNINQYSTLAFTNTRDAITPTGVVVSVAPYALLVLVAAAAGFVFLRKRRED